MVLHRPVEPALDQDAKINRLTTVWDGAMIADADIQALLLLALD